MPPWCQVPPLDGELVRLEPLSFDHTRDLAVAAEEDRGAYGWTLVPRADEVESYLAAQFGRVEQGLVPFAQIRRADGRAVGCTAFWSPRYWPDGRRLLAVEIGFTWLGASAQGSGINAEAKLLLLRHAFEVLGVARVDFKTDARNTGSRRALAALGGQFEGVLRRWSISWVPGEDGLLRDSAMYSVTTADWAGVRDHLARRVAAHRSARDRAPAGGSPAAPRSTTPADSEPVAARYDSPRGETR